MYRRGTLLCADPAVGLIRAHTLQRLQSSPEAPNPALQLPGMPARYSLLLLYWDIPKGLRATILPNWLGFPNKNLRKSSGHTSMDLSYNHLPNWFGDHVSAMCVISFTEEDRNEIM